MRFIVFIALEGFFLLTCTKQEFWPDSERWHRCPLSCSRPQRPRTPLSFLLACASRPRLSRWPSWRPSSSCLKSATTATTILIPVEQKGWMKSSLYRVSVETSLSSSAVECQHLTVTMLPNVFFVLSPWYPPLGRRWTVAPRTMDHEDLVWAPPPSTPSTHPHAHEWQPEEEDPHHLFSLFSLEDTVLAVMPTNRY